MSSPTVPDGRPRWMRPEDAALRRTTRRRFGNREGGMIPEGRADPTEYLFTIQEAADRLRVSRWSVYNLIHARQLRTIKIGRRRLVTPAALAECIELLGRGRSLMVKTSDHIRQTRPARPGVASASARMVRAASGCAKTAATATPPMC